MKSFYNRVALITGAASGIGRALSLRLAEEGMNLYLLDVNGERLAEVLDAAQQLGVLAVGRQCDVSQLPEIEASVNHGLQHWGTIDLLVNNAGVAYFGSTDQMTSEHCERLLAVNLMGPLHFTRLLLPTLLARPEAHVLNVASFFGLVGIRKLAAYAASKFGLVGYSEALRAEYARTNLGVTCLCPGFVDTNLFTTAPLGPDRQSQKVPPAWMLTSPERVAERAVRAIQRNEALVVMQTYAKAVHLFKRWFPGVIDFANHLSRKRLKVNSPDTSTDEKACRAA